MIESIFKRLFIILGSWSYFNRRNHRFHVGTLMLTKFNSKDNFWDLFESRDYIVSRMVHVPSKDRPIARYNGMNRAAMSNGKVNFAFRGDRFVSNLDSIAADNCAIARNCSIKPCKRDGGPARVPSSTFTFPHHRKKEKKKKKKTDRKRK